MNDKVRLWGKRVSAVAISIAMVGGSFPTTALAEMVPEQDVQLTTQDDQEGKIKLIVTNVLAGSKTYDGSTSTQYSEGTEQKSILDFSKAYIAGLEEGDQVRIVDDGSEFEDKNAGAGKTINLKLKIVGDDENKHEYEIDTTQSQTTTTGTIEPLEAQLEWGQQAEFTYDGEQHAPTATVTNKVDNDEVSFTVDGAQTDVGEYTDGDAAKVTELTGGDKDNYVMPDKPGTMAFSITKANQEVTGIEVIDSTYSGQPQDLLSNAGTASGGGEISYGVTAVDATDAPTDWGTAIPQQTNAGEWKVWYKVAETANYNAVDPTAVSSNAKIKPKPVTVSLDKTSNVYNADEQRPSLKVDGVVDGDECGAALTGTAATSDYKDAGIYSIGENVELTNSNGNYEINKEEQQPLTYEITKANVTVTAGKLASREYDGTTNVPKAQEGLDFEIPATIAGIQGEDQQYVQVTVDTQKTYTYDNKAAGDRKASIDYVLSNINDSTDRAKNYTLNSSEKLVAAVETPGTITQKTVTVGGITAEDKDYDGNTTATIRSDTLKVFGLLDQDDVTIGDKVTGEFEKADVGKWNVALNGLALGGKDAGNYSLDLAHSQSKTQATINKATATVKLTCNSLTYNGSKQELASAVATPTDAEILWYVGNDEPKDTDWKNEVPTAKEAGKYTVWCKVKGTDNYNPSGIVKGTATIVAAPLTVKADAKSKVEGADDPALTYQVSGLKGSDKSADVVTGTLTRDAGEAPGTYAIKQGSVRTKSANYTLKYEAADFTISAKPLPDTVTVSPVTAHLMNIGDVTYGPDAPFYGTTGESRRVESLQMQLADQPVAGSIEYRSHVQNQGWETSWAKDGERSGTTKLSRRLEAVAIRLTPGSEMEKNYDVYYRMHVENVGWMGWAKNGQYAGTSGFSRRCEAYQIAVVKKGSPAPGATYKGITQNTDAPFIAAR